MVNFLQIFQVPLMESMKDIIYPSSTQMSYYLPYQMQQQGFQMSTWENLGFPIHGQVVGKTQEIYAWHVRTYNQYYRNSMS